MKDSEAMDKTLRTGRLIVAAMMLASVALAAVAVFINTTGVHEPSFDNPRLLLYIMAGLFVVEVPIYALATTLVARVTARMPLHDGDPEALDAAGPRGYLSLVIIRGAIGEGLALLGGITLLIGGEWLALVGVGAGLAMMILTFPTRGGLESFCAQVRSAGAGPLR